MLLNTHKKTKEKEKEKEMIFLQSNQEKKLSKSKSQPNILDVDREEIENNVVWTFV